MTTLTVLPPGPEPKKETAHYRPKNLQEQLMAFLNSNNRKSFKEDPEYKYEPPPLEYAEGVQSIVSILLEIADKEYLTLDRFKDYAARISKASGKRKLTGKHTRKVAFEQGITSRGIPISHAYNLVAKIFGYAHYHDAKANSVSREGFEKPFIYNQRKAGEFKAEFFPIY